METSRRPSGRLSINMLIGYDMIMWYDGRWQARRGEEWNQRVPVSFFVCHVNYSVRIALQMGENVFLSTAFLFSWTREASASEKRDVMAADCLPLVATSFFCCWWLKEGRPLKSRRRRRGRRRNNIRREHKERKKNTRNGRKWRRDSISCQLVLEGVSGHVTIFGIPSGSLLFYFLFLFFQKENPRNGGKEKLCVSAAVVFVSLCPAIFDGNELHR